jgi:hypothetical protein
MTTADISIGCGAVPAVPISEGRAKGVKIYFARAGGEASVRGLEC